MPDSHQSQSFLLPLSIAQPLDLGRVIREISIIDEHLRQEAIRNPEKQIAVKASLKLDHLLKSNNVDINNASHRAALLSWLESLRETATKVSISFGEAADDQFIQKLAEWFRREIDPQCLITVGLEPSIGVGSVVRTDNRVFDLSLKSRLKATRELLVREIRQVAERESP